MIASWRPLLSWGLPLLVLLTLQTACGRKTLPIPPQDAVPEAITDLQYRQDENHVTLAWTYPARTTVGSELPGLKSFLILRAVVPEEDYCPTCPLTFSSTIEIEAETAITDPKQRRAHYSETILRPRHRYLYRVQSKAGWRLVSDDSNTVSFFWDSPVVAPTELVAEAGDGQVTLRWQGVNRLVNGEEINGPEGYQLYRGPSDDDLVPLGEVLTSTNFTDAGLTNGQRYHYKVRAVRQVNGSRLIGLASHPLAITPLDLTPPLPPRGLTAVLATGGVKLLWERGSEKDLAGYRIWRRLPSEASLRQIGEVDRAEVSFFDPLPQAEDGCSWAITAFDKATPANESTPSKEVYHEPF